MNAPQHRFRKGVVRSVVRHALTSEWRTFDEIHAGMFVPASSARTALRYLVSAGEADAKWQTDPSRERRMLYRRAAP